MSKISRAAVVALKPGRPAKSRLASLGDTLRRELAWAMAADTLIALQPALDQVLVVGGARTAELARLGLDVEVIDDPAETGLNAALRHGSQILQGRGVETVLACVGDLPALTPSSVQAVLTAAEPHDRAYVADRTGIGTTMLITNRGPLQPLFGGASAAAHRASGADPLSPDQLAVPDARADVDTEDDLDLTARLGFGRTTSEVLARAGRSWPTRS